MSNAKAFSVDIGSLKKRPKDEGVQQAVAVDKAADKLGFIEREPKRRGGRAPSPRTGQIHAKVFPRVQEQIATEARVKGTQQGVVIEEAWALYCEKHGIEQ